MFHSKENGSASSNSLPDVVEDHVHVADGPDSAVSWAGHRADQAGCCFAWDRNYDPPGPPESVPWASSGLTPLLLRVNPPPQVIDQISDGATEPDARDLSRGRHPPQRSCGYVQRDSSFLGCVQNFFGVGGASHSPPPSASVGRLSH